MQQLFEQFGIDDLSQSVPYQAKEAAEYMESELSLDKLIKLSPGQLKSIIKAKASEAVMEYKSKLLSVMTAVLLSAVLNTIGENIKHDEIFDLICILSITAILLEPVLSCIGYSCDTVRELSRFMLIYIPIYTAIMAASGAVGTAAVYQTSVMAAAQIFSQLTDKIFMPMMQSFMMLSVSSTVSGNKGIKSMAAAIKKASGWGLTFAATAFTGIVSVQSFISSAADSAAAKTLKFIAGSFVPIIGGAFSDALSAMQGSMRIIKTSVGGFGIAVALLTFIPVLVRISVLRAVIWFSKTAADILSAGRCSEILGCFSDLLSLLTAILLAVMMVFIISTAIMVNTVTSL